MKPPLVDKLDDVMSGTPVFHGTRVPVRNLTDYLAGGSSIDDFLDDFPTVTREQALEFLKTAELLVIAQSNANPDR